MTKACTRIQNFDVEFLLQLAEEEIVSPQHFVEMYMTTEATPTTSADHEGEEEDESQRLETAIIHRRNSIGYTVDDGRPMDQFAQLFLSRVRATL